MKIPFDIKYRPQIESGEYKVETRDGRPVRIICWDCNNYNPIIALADETVMWNGDKNEYVISYCIDGRYGPAESQDDLFIVTPEEELSVFEEGLNTFLFDFVHTTVDEDPIKYVKKNSNVLLSFARQQFIKDGYVIEKKAFHDTVKKVDPEVMKEVSKNIDNTELTEFEQEVSDIVEYCKKNGKIVANGYAKRHAKTLLYFAEKELSTKYKFSSDLNGFAYGKGYEDGKKEALKDLPRWKKVGLDTGQTTLMIGYTGDEDKLYRNGYVISLTDLDKLPKEDKK